MQASPNAVFCLCGLHCARGALLRSAARLCGVGNQAKTGPESKSETHQLNDVRGGSGGSWEWWYAGEHPQARRLLSTLLPGWNNAGGTPCVDG